MGKNIAVLMLLLTGLLTGRADEPAARELARQLVDAFNSPQATLPDPATAATNMVILQKAIGETPADPALHFALATCYLAQKNNAAAFASLDKACVLSQYNPRMGMVYALLLKRNREPLKARAVFAQMVAAHPELPPLGIALASLDLTVQKYAEAAALIQNVRDHAPADLAENDQAALLYMLGTCRLYQGDPAGAIELLQQAVRHMPKSVVMLAMLGEAHLKAGDLSAAKNDLDQGLAINPQYSAALYYQGVWREREGSRELATALFQAAYDNG